MASISAKWLQSSQGREILTTQNSTSNGSPRFERISVKKSLPTLGGLKTGEVKRYYNFATTTDSWRTCVRPKEEKVVAGQRKIGVRASLAGEPQENSVWSLPPNTLPEGKWQQAFVKVERGFNTFCTNSVITLLDILYKDRPYARFYVLETIARVPYFAFTSVLHMYESFGWWRRADYLKVHFAESWNELHHLLIMEALGGDRLWIDRFLAQHIAVAYFFITAAMYTLSPRMAYHFSECVEAHAYATYDKFVRKHGEELKKLPAPEVAVRYYTEGDLYMFDEFQTSGSVGMRRPIINNLHDVFCAIREDEAEHCKTMRACQTPSVLLSPHRDFVATTPSCSAGSSVLGSDSIIVGSQVILPPAECSGILECAVTATSYAVRMDQKKEVALSLLDESS